MGSDAVSANVGDQQYKTEKTLNGSDKLRRMRALLDGRLAHRGQLFAPSAGFYRQDLAGMAAELLQWLGVNPGSDQLIFDFAKKLGGTGLYFQENSKHYILVDKKFRKNAEAQAAILAHELMHYVLMGGCQYYLVPDADNEQLTDLSVVYAGFGPVVLNGWQQAGFYGAEEFGRLVVRFGRGFGMTQDAIATRLNQRAAVLLSTAKAPEKTTRKRRWGSHRDRALAVVGTVISIALIIALKTWLLGGGHSSAQSRELSAQQTQLTALRQQYDSCSHDLDQKRAKLDDTDYAAVNTFNQEVNSCNTTRDQYNRALAALNQKIDQYNQKK